MDRKYLVHKIKKCYFILFQKLEEDAAYCSVYSMEDILKLKDSDQILQFRELVTELCRN